MERPDMTISAISRVERTAMPSPTDRPVRIEVEPASGGMPVPALSGIEQGFGAADALMLRTLRSVAVAPDELGVVKLKMAMQYYEVNTGMLFGAVNQFKSSLDKLTSQQ